MKSKIIKSLALLAISIMTFSCTKCIPGGENVLYKTRGDYFDLVRITVMDGKFIYPTLSQFEINSRFMIQLQDNYVFSMGNFENVNSDIFLSLTWLELYKLEEELNTAPLLMEVLEEFILDTDPYLEFYRDDICTVFRDTERLNRMIRNGELDKYFNRLK